MRSRVTIPLAILLSGALAGCFGGKNVDEGCADLAEYQSSANAPRIRTPEGLTPPAQSSGYVVPPGEDEEPRGASCLARPPPYFRPDPAAPAQPAPPPAS